MDALFSIVLMPLWLITAGLSFSIGAALAKRQKLHVTVKLLLVSVVRCGVVRRDVHAREWCVGEGWGFVECRGGEFSRVDVGLSAVVDVLVIR